MKYIISNDSNYIGFINNERYISFINEDWTLVQIFTRFKDENKKNHLIIWKTIESSQCELRINEVVDDRNKEREFISSITVTNNRLYIVNYETLSMAAQYDDIKLPEPHLSNYYVELENGEFYVKVIEGKNQLYYINFIKVDSVPNKNNGEIGFQ